MTEEQQYIYDERIRILTQGEREPTASEIMLAEQDAGIKPRSTGEIS